MSKLKLHHSRAARHAFTALGFIALLLGIIGIFLPMLPTTPFILLAAALFARGSERLHAWLLMHHITGPLIAAWYQHQSLGPGIKRLAYVVTIVSFGSSMLIVKALALKCLLLGLALLLLYFLWRIPVRRL